MSPIRLYRLASPPVKRQLWMTIAAGVFIAVSQVYAQTPTGESSTGLDRWLTVPNIFMAVTFVYGVGTLREQFAEVKRRMDAFEKDYLPREVFEERLRGMKRS